MSVDKNNKVSYCFMSGFSVQIEQCKCGVEFKAKIPTWVQVEIVLGP